jgi:hypothetical protein
VEHHSHSGAVFEADRYNQPPHHSRPGFVAMNSTPLPSDFLRMEPDIGSQNPVGERQRADPSQRSGNSGPVYIGPSGRSMSAREQRTDHSQEAAAAAEPSSARQRNINRPPSSKSNCKQQ